MTIILSHFLEHKNTGKYSPHSYFADKMKEETRKLPTNLTNNNNNSPFVLPIPAKVNLYKFTIEFIHI
jgi:hypothetical protein